jgi:hypothetical protein
MSSSSSSDPRPEGRGDGEGEKARSTQGWRTFANRYGAGRAYWYVPKGLAVTADALKPRLKVLKEFEYGKSWRDCQQAYIQRLNEKGISEAEAEWAEGGAPLARSTPGFGRARVLLQQACEYVAPRLGRSKS